MSVEIHMKSKFDELRIHNVKSVKFGDARLQKADTPDEYDFAFGRLVIEDKENNKVTFELFGDNIKNITPKIIK